MIWSKIKRIVRNYNDYNLFYRQFLGGSLSKLPIRSYINAIKAKGFYINFLCYG